MIGTTGVLGTMRILIIDDEPAVIRVMQEFLKGTPCEVVAVDTAEAAESLIRADQFKVVVDQFQLAIIDVNLDPGSGMDALKAVKSVAPGISVVMTTGGDQDKAAEEPYLGLGASAFIYKPFGLSVFRKAVFAALYAPVHILIVDDDTLARKLAHRMIARTMTMPHRIDLAADGVEAMQLYVLQEHDIILLDHNMPRLDGFEVARRVRQHSDKGKAIPIIGISADSGDRYNEFKERCFEVGYSDFAPKPFDKIGLAETIEQWILTPRKHD